MKRSLALAAMLVLGGLNFATVAQAQTQAGKSCCQPAAACCAPAAACCPTKKSETKAPTTSGTTDQKAKAQPVTSQTGAVQTANAGGQNCCEPAQACCAPGAACCKH